MDVRVLLAFVKNKLYQFGHFKQFDLQILNLEIIIIVWGPF